MRTVKLLIVVILFSCSLVSFGQENDAEKMDKLAQIRAQRLSIVNNLESQVKDIPFAEVRVYARYKIASWLWEDGKDDTGKAEAVATAAIDDYYKNKSEIRSASSIPQLFNLLDAHAGDLAKKLREKYKVSSKDDAQRIPDLLGQKDGEKLAVDAAISLLSQQNETSPDLTYLLMTLDQRGSVQLNTLLAAILAADESGRNRLPTHMIEILTGFFIKPTVSDDLRRRFIRLVLERTRNVVAMSVLDQLAYYRTMQRLWPSISENYPEMVAEAGTVRTLLNARVSSSMREANERNERIQNSPDKLAATVTEAENANNDAEKYGLYRSAARLALEKKRFVYAVDLMEKASEIDASGKSTPKDKDFRKKIHDEFYRDVVTASLKADEPDAAHRSVKKMNAPLFKAKGLGQIAKYEVIDKNNLDAGRDAYDEAIKIVSKTESSADGIAALIRMLPTAHKIDSSRLLELARLIAKRINTVPSLTVDDKPDTKNYREYVAKVMTINFDLQGALAELVKLNRNAAEDLAGRIERKEVKVIAEYVMSTSSLESLSKQSVGQTADTITRTKKKLDNML